MSQLREKIMSSLSTIALPDGGDLVSRDMVRALTVDGGAVSFVIEAETPAQAGQMEAQRRAAESAILNLSGVERVSVILTAHNASGTPPKAAPGAEPPSLKIGGHPKPQAGPLPVPGVTNVIAIASGKGGVGKSTLSSNLAVALARQGRKVGLLDADILGPSQPRMMGSTQRPSSPDGEKLIPIDVHGVKMMSIGLMLKSDREAVVWRGPMLMGALQQMMFQVDWAPLDVLIIDLPPGTGDVQLTLAQKTQITGAIIVSTPQDIALLDARKAIDMFDKVKVPILGLIENMSTYVCPSCGHEAHLFGHGGVREEAEHLGAPFLGEIPLALDIRLAGDSGTPAAAGEGPLAEAYATLARDLVKRGIA